MTSDNDNSVKIEIEKMKNQANTSLMDELRFIDELPDAPAKYVPFFPYGTPERRPYGWFSEYGHVFDPFVHRSIK